MHGYIIVMSEVLPKGFLELHGYIILTSEARTDKVSQAGFDVSVGFEFSM